MSGNPFFDAALAAFGIPMRNSTDAAPAPPDRTTSSSTPMTPKYVCRSPHCCSPDIPLTDFELMEPILQDLLFRVRLPLAELRERLTRREFGDERLVERMGLKFCYEGLSFKAVKKKMKSVEVGRELTRAVDDLFDADARARQGKSPIGFVVAEYFISCLTELFALVQRSILEERAPTDGSIHFCLHDVHRNASILREMGNNRGLPPTNLLPIYKTAALWQEIRAGIASGRITGAGWTLGERSNQDILDLLKDDTNLIMESVLRLDGRLISASNHVQKLISWGTTTTPMLELYCNLANDQNLFLDTPLLAHYLDYVRSMSACRCSICMPAFTPSPSFSADSRALCPTSRLLYVWSNPPTTRPTSSISSQSAERLPVHPFFNLNRPDQFEDLGLIQQPPICPPDRCSGQPAIAANYPLVEQCILRIVGWTLSAVILREQVDSLHSDIAVRVAEEVGSLEVGTVESRRKILEALPKALHDEIQDVEHSGRLFILRLHNAMCGIRTLLDTVRRNHQSCLCDLTHLCDELSKLVDKAKIEFAKAYVTPVLTTDTATTTRRIEEQFRIVANEQKRTRWKSTGWQNQVKGFAKFVNEPLASLLRDPSTRLAAHDLSLSMVMVLGSSRILEEAFSIDVETHFPFPREGEAETAFMRAVKSVVAHSRLYRNSDNDDFYVRAEDAVEMREEADEMSTSPRCPAVRIALYAAASIVDPTDYLSRLNSAALRLESAKTRTEFSRVVSDSTFALYYGGPNYKAYYRRGYALTQLKMWDKAILDFERAVALEPRNVFLKERLRLAKMKRS